MRRPRPAPPPTRNIASAASVHASNEPVPVQYWKRAINDGIVRDTPLPPDMWATWTENNPPRQWVQYAWPTPVTLNESRIRFWADQPAGASSGVAPPKNWRIDYWTGGGWRPVADSSGYGTATDAEQVTRFDPVETRCVRAVFDASGESDDYAAVAVVEWAMLAPTAAAPHAVSKEAAACDAGD